MFFPIPGNSRYKNITELFRPLTTVKNPKVGLINIGEESSKGSELYQEAYSLLKRELPNFIGNVESRNILISEADVLICDGCLYNTASFDHSKCMAPLTQ